MSVIRTTLPPRVSGDDALGPLLDACGAELDRLEANALTLSRRTAASTADAAGLARWSDELGLVRRYDLGTEARRAAVIQALDLFTGCTPEKLRRMLGRMTGGVVTLDEDFPNGCVGVTVVTDDALPPDLQSAEAAMRRMLPAHLSGTLSAQAAMDGRVQHLFLLRGDIVISLEEET